MMQQNIFQPDSLPTAIGSFPFTNTVKAMDIILRNLPEIPTWPQLPSLSFLEGFYTQFVNSMPAIRINKEKQTMFMDTTDTGLSELEGFYEHVLSEDLDFFAMPESYSSGLPLLLKHLQKDKTRRFAVKGHVTGPISFGLGLLDENQKAIVYNEPFFEAVRNSVRLQAAWQVEALKPFGENVIIFLDEPLLMNFGSAFNQLTRQQALDWINESADEIHKHGGLVGVHCCGNTEWPILFDANVDIVNFDAFEFFDSIKIYEKELAKFLDRNGIMACGIVPTTEKDLDTPAEDLMKMFLDNMESLNTGRSLKDLFRQVMITPACGLGTVSEKYPEIALSLCATLSKTIRTEFGL